MAGRASVFRVVSGMIAQAAPSRNARVQGISETPDIAEFYRGHHVPIYEYRRNSEAMCSECADGFEILQKMSDAPLQSCPGCGAPVERIISAPFVGSPGPALSRDNLEKHGFTQYRRAGAGVYEKTAGKGPETLKK